MAAGRRGVGGAVRVGVFMGIIIIKKEIPALSKIPHAKRGHAVMAASGGGQEDAAAAMALVSQLREALATAQNALHAAERALAGSTGGGAPLGPEPSAVGRQQSDRPDLPPAPAAAAGCDEEDDEDDAERRQELANERYMQEQQRRLQQQQREQEGRREQQQQQQREQQ